MAGLGRLQGQHRVSGTSTNSLDRGGDKAAGNCQQQQAGDKEKVIYEIIQRLFFWICEVYKYPPQNSSFLQVRVPVPGREERIKIMENLIEKRSIIEQVSVAQENLDEKERE